MLQDLETAIKAALRAGLEILSIYDDPLADFSVERKADNSPLTIADKKSHEAIMGFLETTRYPVLSEEGRDIPYAERAQWDTLWIVDPLDGTKEFIKRNGEFTVNIALVRKGVPVLGVIYLPVKQQLYFAAEGIGAYKCLAMPADTRPMEQWLEISSRLPLDTGHDRFVVVASRSHCSPETLDFIAQLEQEHGQVERVSSGSSIKICLVAEGTADVYPRFAPTMEWDTAAGHAIALMAGKEVYQYPAMQPMVYNKEDLLNPWFIVR